MSYNLTSKFFKRVLSKALFVVTILIQNFSSFAQHDFFNPPPLHKELPPWMIETSRTSITATSKFRNDYNFSERNGSEITFNWLYNFDGQFTEMSLGFIFTRGWQYMQNVYKTKGHNENNFYKRYVYEDPFEVDAKIVADEIVKIAKRYQYDNAKVALSFVQSLPHDPDIGSYQRYAIECLIDRRGDCSDKSVLLMAILSFMGYETIALEYPTHLAVGITDYGHKSIYYGQRYRYNGFYFYYADANALGVNIGDEEGKTKFSKLPATINKGYIKESSIYGQTYSTVCERCGGDGWTHEGTDAGPFHCIKCNGRGRY